jgi:hypothetical protein
MGSLLTVHGQEFIKPPRPVEPGRKSAKWVHHRVQHHVFARYTGHSFSRNLIVVSYDITIVRVNLFRAPPRTSRLHASQRISVRETPTCTGHVEMFCVIVQLWSASAPRCVRGIPKGSLSVNDSSIRDSTENGPVPEGTWRTKSTVVIDIV